MRWRNIRYQPPMPEHFHNAGIQSTDGRFFIAARFGANKYNHLNWGVIDWKTGTIVDGFAYRRDAKRYVEEECLS
jgi:hypothetical protein